MILPVSWLIQHNACQALIVLSCHHYCNKQGMGPRSCMRIKSVAGADIMIHDTLHRRRYSSSALCWCYESDVMRLT